MRYRLRTLLIVLAVGIPVAVFTCVSWVDPDAAACGAFVSAVFASVALLSRYFSSRPRLFVRVFVPKEDYRTAIRGCLRDPTFTSSMRWMSNLQLIVALWVGAVLACFVE